LVVRQRLRTIALIALLTAATLTVLGVDGYLRRLGLEGVGPDILWHAYRAAWIAAIVVGLHVWRTRERQRP
jgi:hypothetical protein